MTLFIDTNVFLSFFHFSSDDLEELRKLGVLVRSGQIALLVPEQVQCEFRRNRDGTVSDAFKKLREQKLVLQFPQISKEYDEYDTLRSALRAVEEAKSALITVLQADIGQNKLKADIVIAELFASARRLPETEDQLGRARDRMLRGNPPGKKNSHGDALNWEALLDGVPDKTDLYFVSGDGDWVSPLDDDRFDSFLTEEWRRKKGSSILFYRRLSAFFREHFPDINLASEEEKERLIGALAQSGSFSRSRALLKQLAAQPDFTSVQLNEIARAATTNNQIYWIMTDGDISRYVRSILAPAHAQLEPELVVEFERRLGRPLIDQQDENDAG